MAAKHRQKRPAEPIGTHRCRCACGGTGWWIEANPMRGPESARRKRRWHCRTQAAEAQNGGTR